MRGAAEGRRRNQEESLAGGLESEETHDHTLGVPLDPIGIARVFAVQQRRIFAVRG
jgi:hypothetical protein